MKTVVVLAGGYSTEHQISLASGRTAEAAFIEAGYKVLFVVLKKDGFWLKDQLIKLTDLSADFVTKPLIRAEKDEEFLEKVNQSLDSEYISKIKHADLRSRFDNFHSFFAGTTHLPVGNQHIYVTRFNKEKLRQILRMSYK